MRLWRNTREVWFFPLMCDSTLPRARRVFKESAFTHPQLFPPSSPRKFKTLRTRLNASASYWLDFDFWVWAVKNAYIRMQRGSWGPSWIELLAQLCVLRSKTICHAPRAGTQLVTKLVKKKRRCMLTWLKHIVFHKTKRWTIILHHLSEIYN
jgi:hypothetical protein